MLKALCCQEIRVKVTQITVFDQSIVLLDSVAEELNQIRMAQTSHQLVFLIKQMPGREQMQDLPCRRRATYFCIGSFEVSTLIRIGLSTSYG